MGMSLLSNAGTSDDVFKCLCDISSNSKLPVTQAYRVKKATVKQAPDFPDGKVGSGAFLTREAVLECVSQRTLSLPAFERSGGSAWNRTRIIGSNCPGQMDLGTYKKLTSKSGLIFSFTPHTMPIPFQSAWQCFVKYCILGVRRLESGYTYKID